MDDSDESTTEADDYIYNMNCVLLYEFTSVHLVTYSMNDVDLLELGDLANTFLIEY